LVFRIKGSGDSGGKEKASGECVSSSGSGTEVTVRTGPTDSKVVRCQRCFAADSTQLQVFEESGLPGLVDAVVGGFHCFVVAYGQGGSGKTHTVVGVPGAERAGMLPRSMERLFQQLEGQGRLRGQSSRHLRI